MAGGRALLNVEPGGPKRAEVNDTDRTSKAHFQNDCAVVAEGYSNLGARHSFERAKKAIRRPFHRV